MNTSLSSPDRGKSLVARVAQEIQDFVEANIIPLYDRFDKAHRRDHVRMVMEQSMALAAQMEKFSTHCLQLSSRDRDHLCISFSFSSSSSFYILL